jgi:microcin C transport system substrate-binding protein
MIRLFAAVLSLACLASPVLADDGPAWRHATSITGTPRYADGFSHFDYVNPSAPKGGTVRFAVEGSFDSTNAYLGTKGTPAAAVAQVYQALMTPALDEVDISAKYGLLAEAVRFPDDDSWVEFRLDPAARWSDGEKLGVDDVIWSFTTLREISPMLAGYYNHVVKAEAVGDDVVRFTFDGPGNRELPQIVSELPVMPKHWWLGTDATGKPRDITETTLEPPLGSGPYKVARVEPGRRIVLERDPNYWGRNHPTEVGTGNFDRMEYEYFLDPTVMLEAFKGDRYDFRVERSAKTWVTAYDFPAKTAGRVVTESFPRRASGVMQAMVVNLRRDKFADARVRRALNAAFDWETLKHTVFYDQYERIDSFFFGTELAARGLPGPEELAILEPLRDKVPASVFTRPYANPVGGSADAVRANLREAVRLFGEAGWKIDGGVMRNARGEPFTIAFLTNDQLSERYIAPYAKALKLIGVGLDFRVVDDAQYQNAMRDFDFDMTVDGWVQSLSPGNEQRDMWSSAAAVIPGSRNSAGIRDGAVDALIDRIVFNAGRDDLIAAVKALDRVLLANDYVIPLFYPLDYRYAYWNRFSRPAELPKYSFGFPDLWWYDADKAARTGAP